MVYRVALRVRNVFLIALYVAALGVAGMLVYNTLQFAQQRPGWFVVVVGATPAPTPTPMPSPTTTTTPEQKSKAMTLATFPTATTIAPVPTVSNTPVPITMGYHPKTGRHIAAWLPPSFSGGARASFDVNKDIMDEISPFWYSTNATGQLYGSRNDELVVLAHENNILVIPSIHNISNYNAVIGVLTDPQLRSRHVQYIIDEVLARNYDGIDIDYESLDTSLRESYSAFIMELAEALHTYGKILSVAVHPKDSEYGGLGGFQDWQIIDQYADRMRIMTYDYHWRGGGPGPVAPLYWVEKVAEYAVSVVDPSKVFIGVPFYGYDWPPQGNARGLPWGDIEDLIVEQDLTVNLMQRNSQGRVDESWLRYQSPQGVREVWFMTDSGLESKLDLVQRMDLAGIAIWQIGYEKPEYWDVIRRKLVQDPVLIQRSINPLLPEH